MIRKFLSIVFSPLRWIFGKEKHEPFKTGHSWDTSWDVIDYKEEYYK